MMISGLVMQCSPALVDEVAVRIRAVPGISDLTIVEPGQLVCVLEAAGPEASARVLDQLVRIPGVYSVMPTYIHELEEDVRWNSPVVHS